MRISGGELKGRVLLTRRTGRVRPTSEKARQSLFDALGDWIRGREVLDIFAGFGSLGLEALSRGAVRAVFVENYPPAARLIGANLARLELEGAGSVIPAAWEAALRRLSRRRETFDLILADPPYSTERPEDSGPARRLLSRIGDYGMLKSEGLFVFEHFSRYCPEPSPGWNVIRRLKHGQTTLTVFTEKR